MQFLVPNESEYPNEKKEFVDKKLQLLKDIQNIITNLNLVSNNKEITEEDKNEEKVLPNKVVKRGISELLPHLYLSGAIVATADVCDQLGINFVISAAPELPDTPLSSITKPLYLRVPVLDRPDAELSIYFDEVADLIEGVHSDGGKILVHCVAGVSRSASLCLAYFMKYRGMSLKKAYEHIKAIRPQIRPNTGFFEQLRKYEEKLFGSTSVKMIYYASLDHEIPDVYESEYKAIEEYYQRKRKEIQR